MQYPHEFNSCTKYPKSNFLGQRSYHDDIERASEPAISENTRIHYPRRVQRPWGAYQVHLDVANYTLGKLLIETLDHGSVVFP